MSSNTSSAKLAAKAGKKSKIITLRLSPAQLSHFPSDVVTTKPSASPDKVEPSPPVPPTEPNEKSSESNATPVPPTGDAVDANALAPTNANKRKRGSGAATGRKRAPPSIDPNGPIRDRARQPKKRSRLGPDGTTEQSQGAAASSVNPIPAHRLGPKANTGNINANLRALDRSGKPCRKWERKPLQIKSFTGASWGTGTWKGYARDSGFAGDVKSDSTGSSDLKPGESSAVASERSHNGVDAGDASLMNIESSPAPIPA